MREKVELLAPAKVNLSLAVKAPREDGYHEIESLVVPISLFDKLAFAHHEGEGIDFSCDVADVPAGEDNLVVRAARLFCESCGLLPNLKIELSKQIPHAAGLGGGSSDAASALLGLNLLFGTELPLAALSAMGAELGSDVPFFVHQSPAVIRGRGEKVEPVSLPKALPLLLIKPPFGVATPWAYAALRRSRETAEAPSERQEFAWGALFNDLERPVFEKHLFLAALKGWLLEQPETLGALMSGSGSTVFALLQSRDAGFPLGERLAQEFGSNLSAYLCETLP